MKKVITYGTYDLLHHGHIRLLERAKALGDYLIVGVTSDGFDKTRGKINVKQSLMERIAAVRATGLADEIIVEEYEGQKIDDINRFDVDIFTVGSDWVGKFDYLNQYCQVVYLPRTEGVSSSEIRAEKRTLRLGLVGNHRLLLKYKNESGFVNGVEIAGICSNNEDILAQAAKDGIVVTSDYQELLNQVDAVYVVSHPQQHYAQVKQALLQDKHVLCESPIALRTAELTELFNLAAERKLILMEGIKTAYSTAYHRLLLLVKSGCIGNVISVDATCTSLFNPEEKELCTENWSSLCGWGPAALLAVFQLLGTDYLDKNMTACLANWDSHFDIFTKIDFRYANAVASIKVGKGVKSEGELIVSGTKGYIYVPAPWWKTDYFEIRYENQSENKRYFYQLDGEGIRHEIVNFVKSIEMGIYNTYIEQDVSLAICRIMEDFAQTKNVNSIDMY